MFYEEIPLWLLLKPIVVHGDYLIHGVPLISIPSYQFSWYQEDGIVPKSKDDWDAFIIVNYHVVCSTEIDGESDDVCC